MPGFWICLSWNIRKVPLCQGSVHTFPVQCLWQLYATYSSSSAWILEFFLTFSHWRQQCAVTCFENICQLMISRGKKLGLQLPQNTLFLKYKIVPFPEIWGIFYEIFISWNIRKTFSWENIRNFWGVSVSWNIRTAFFWETVKENLILELVSSMFPRIKEIFSGWIFLIFRVWAEKCAR